MEKSSEKLPPGRPSTFDQPLLQMQFRATEQQRQRWREAADKAGMTLSAWLREAAERMLEESGMNG